MNKFEKVTASVCEGKIQGFKNRSTFSGAEFYSFLGVPYGQSTAGNARFKDPVEVKPWKNVLNATTAKNGCFQFSLRQKITLGSEDCLYNNIHTPQLPGKNNEESLKSVIVVLHPGGFLMGTPDPDYYGSPEYVMHNDVVYVCISFRIHILGFLNLNLKECSGNQGIKDVILSLQWIQRNISNFSGDPNNITLIGSSSGAQMIHELMISPRAKGLFHKAVIMGLYKYCPFLIIREQHSTIAFQLAQTLGYTGPHDNKKLLMFFKKLDLQRLIFARLERSFHEGYAPIAPNPPFLPSPEFGENPVISSCGKQKELESTARIPLMIGFCKNEAILGFLPPHRNLTVENYYQSVRQNCWGWGSKLNDSQIELLRKRIESQYLDGKSIKNAPLRLKCDIQTDIGASDLYPSLINLIAADLPSSVYVYKFLFEGNAITMKNLSKFVFEEGIDGTFHGDDYAHWNHFDYRDHSTTAKKTLSPETKKIVKIFTKLITTFAKTGDPNYEGITTQWKPTTVENPCYLSIENNLQMVNGKLYGDRMEFLENLRKELETTDQ